MLEISLPKWPALIVAGEPVTLEQASEIIIRTDNFYFTCNDREWQKQLCAAAGMEMASWGPDYEVVQKAYQRYGILDLNYLENEQIASSYIGGPKGWCGWEGSIGCNTFNIGKWPSVEEVFDDWKIIAVTFPFLKLESQLLSGETCEEGIYPLVQFSVENGEVSVAACDENTKMLRTPVYNFSERMLNKRFGEHGERGCDLETFKQALKLCDKN